MNGRRRWLLGLGCIGLVAGLLLVGIAPLGGADLEPLARGYGLMLFGSAAYLVIGLTVVGAARVRVERRRSVGARLVEPAGSARAR